MGKAEKSKEKSKGIVKTDAGNLKVPTDWNSLTAIMTITMIRTQDHRSILTKYPGDIDNDRRHHHKTKDKYESGAR